MTTTQAPEKTPNAFQRGVNAVIDLLSSFFLPKINLHYTDGTVQYVRNADHNTPSEALAWMDDRSSIVLLLKYVN